MDKYPLEIKKDLGRLSDKAKLFFAALTCDHLYPNYVHFQETTGWGDPETLREAIDTIYQYLINGDLYTSNDIQVWIDSVDLITPDTEDFPEITSSYALDACTAVLSTLRFITESNLDCIVEVATYARDTVDMYVQIRDDFNSSDPNIEARIAADPLMIREKRRQCQLIERLLVIDLNKVTDALIESLRSREPIIGIDAL
ncbi:DUF416 family protein [Dyadobacter diqingensis]|uniref:DUF416 family protein n=1 Tax=Dyadobacter diqingensis TaxID=2938121 RepID=UPI0020C48803|nr:DUF416 family protein [Dyadobacter diqingensis]